VMLEMEGYEPVFSRRNVDVGEPLRRGEPHSLTFPVGIGSHAEPATVTLGLINYRAGWGASLSDYRLVNVQPGQQIYATLTVTPTLDAQLGTGEPIVDVEAYVGGELVGGFRKLDVPPISVHKPHEKSYAESEITIDPYPPQLGQESRVSAVLHNTDAAPATVEVEFGWAKFGMGIPFTTAGMAPPNLAVTLDPATTTTAEVGWTPTYTGHQCVQVRVTDPEGQLEPQVSQRNVDVDERPPCGETKVYTFTIYNDSPLTTTVDIGLITFNVPSDWEVTVDPSGSVQVGPYSEVVITVTVRIPCPPTSSAMRAMREIYALQEGAGGEPTIDVEGYVNGELLGGIEIRFSAPDSVSHIVMLPLILKSYPEQEDSNRDLQGDARSQGWIDLPLILKSYP